ncbi:MAG: DUF420 domain-containing protein [Bacteroidetes bacterium]|nr:MAG: DUF420 domain-containing protein [Bacteroidota bacterium]
MSTELQVSEKKLKKFKRLIWVASVLIPLVVAILFKVEIKGVEIFKGLPAIYASINGLTAILLLAALFAIKRSNMKLHKQLIHFCLGLSLLFLACYVAYHMTNERTEYGNDGAVKYLYYFVLITHVFLSVAVIPLVLNTYLIAWMGDYKRHKKWTRITWPIWFYVAVSGVVVYLMISPFYK